MLSERNDRGGGFLISPIFQDLETQMFHVDFVCCALWLVCKKPSSPRTRESSLLDNAVPFKVGETEGDA